MRLFWCLIVAVIILIVNCDASYNKTLFSTTQAGNSVACLSFTYFYTLGSVGNLGHLLIVEQEVDVTGHLLNSDKEVDRIPLIRASALNWNQHSRTIYFDHLGNHYIISIKHQRPTEIQSTAVMIDATVTKKKCPNESPNVYPTDPPITDLPSTPIMVTTTLSFTTQFKSTIEPTTIMMTTPSPEKHDGGETTIDHQSPTDSVTTDQRSTLIPTMFTTKLDTSVMQTSDSLDTIGASTEPTIVSTTDLPIIELPSTSLPHTSERPVTRDDDYWSTNYFTGPTIVTTINPLDETMSSTVNYFTETLSVDENQSITSTYNYDGQMSTKSSTEEPFQPNNSTQLLTTINDSKDSSSQSGANEIDTSNQSDQPNTKTGNLADDLLATIKLLSHKTNLIYSICSFLGLIVLITSLTITVNHLRSEKWQPSKSNVSVDPSGVELDVLTFHRRTINSNILKVLSDYRKSRKSMAETVIQFKK